MYGNNTSEVEAEDGIGAAQAYLRERLFPWLMSQRVCIDRLHSIEIALYTNMESFTLYDTPTRACFIAVMIYDFCY